VRRLLSPEQINGGLMLSVALVGVLVNLAATWMFARANGASERRSLNLEGAAAHVLTDLYAFAATAVAAVVIVTTGFTRADPIATLVVVVLMLHAGSGLVRKSGRIFLEAAPAGLDIAALGAAMAARPHVAEVHDLHIWEITTEMPAASAHVLVEPAQDCHAVRADLEELLYREYGIRHLTLQVDHLAGDSAHEHHDGEHADSGRHPADGHGPAGHSAAGHGHEHSGDNDGEHDPGEHGDHEEHAAGLAHCEDSHGPSYRPARDG
jgi:cobalt-zinc-cadmium efflux system protein